MWPEWMSRETLADYLDLKAGAVDQYVKRGMLPHPRTVGDGLRWWRKEIDDRLAMTAQARHTPTQDAPHEDIVSHAIAQAAAARQARPQ